jgi:DNA repair protein RecO (recombination protein O)
MYLNELLVRALPRLDPYPTIFHAYQKTLANLQAAQLRLFEKIVLRELGYGFSLDKETANGLPIQPEQWYEFMPAKGLNQCNTSNDKQVVFKGKSLLALHDEKLETGEDLHAAKILHRMAIRALLGERDLKSRVFFQISPLPVGEN